MPKYLYILILASLACGAQSALPTLPPTATTEAEVETTLTGVVLAQSLNVRACPSETCTAEYKGLGQNAKVKLYLACTGGELKEWASINRDCTRWVKVKWLEVEE